VPICGFAAPRYTAVVTEDAQESVPAAASRNGADVSSALARLAVALEGNQPRIREALEKGKVLAGRGGDGGRWGDILLSEEPPALHEVLNEALQELLEANWRYRRAVALALHDEGFTMQRIGELFGISRQRVSHLLRSEADGARASDDL
jgi:hypothetical protein